LYPPDRSVSHNVFEGDPWAKRVLRFRLSPLFSWTRLFFRRGRGALRPQSRRVICSFPISFFCATPFFAGWIDFEGRIGRLESLSTFQFASSFFLVLSPRIPLKNPARAVPAEQLVFQHYAYLFSHISLSTIRLRTHSISITAWRMLVELMVFSDVLNSNSSPVHVLLTLFFLVP